MSDVHYHFDEVLHYKQQGKYNNDDDIRNREYNVENVSPIWPVVDSI